MSLYWLGSNNLDGGYEKWNLGYEISGLGSKYIDNVH